MLLLELERGQVRDARMRSHRVVVLPPDFDDRLGFAPGAEPLEAQALIAEAAVERFVGTVLPWLARINQRRLDVRRGQPLQDGVAYELGAVVGSKEQRRTVATHEPGQHLDYARGADAAGDVDCQALVGELVDHRQTLELLAVGAGVEYEIVGPDLVRGDWRQRTGSACGNPTPRTFARQAESGMTPQTASAIDTHTESFSTQEDPNPPIAVARILGRQPTHRRERRRILAWLAQPIAQCRSRDAQQPARSPLRHAARTHEADLVAAGLRAHHFFRFTSRITSSSRSRSASRRLSFGNPPVSRTPLMVRNWQQGVGNGKQGETEFHGRVQA